MVAHPGRWRTRRADTSATAGRFSLDEAADVVHHHVEVSLLPNWVGGVQVRRAHLDGDVLTLTAEVTSRKGVSSTHVLVWRRAQPR